jgi:hypothetical protein
MQMWQARCDGAPGSSTTNDSNPDFLLKQTHWNPMLNFLVGFGSDNCGHGRSRIRRVSVATSPGTSWGILFFLREPPHRQEAAGKSRVFANPGGVSKLALEK